MAKTNFKQISQNIKKYRLLNNMTQEDLAAALELDPQYYAQLERSERNFTLEKVIRLCSILHVNIEDIIDINNEKTHATQETLTHIENCLTHMTESQLLVVDKFISEIIPYIK